MANKTSDAFAEALAELIDKCKGGMADHFKPEEKKTDVIVAMGKPKDEEEEGSFDFGADKEEEEGDKPDADMKDKVSDALSDLDEDELMKLYSSLK